MILKKTPPEQKQFITVVKDDDCDDPNSKQIYCLELRKSEYILCQ